LRGRQFTPQQLEILKADLRGNACSRLSKEDVELNRVDFERKLPKLRKEWEREKGADLFKGKVKAIALLVK
jgi:hypothetical protein